MSRTKPRVALDMYVLAQGVKTGVYRVCDELFPRLALSPRLNTRLLYRPGDEERAAGYVAARRLGVPAFDAAADGVHGDHGHAAAIDVLLSPFGVAPTDWLLDPTVLQAHIVYDLIAIRRPDYFSAAAAAEVRDIIDSLGEHTVVFAISEFTKKDLLAYRGDLSPSQVTVIPLAAGPAFQPCTDASRMAAVRAKYGVPVDAPFVLSLATLEIRKNLDQVVNAFVRFMEHHPSSALHLVLAGMSGWKLEQLNDALAAAGPWRSRIVLTGFVDDADLSALYSAALCFVYLSRYEGFGLPPLEAMACGTPVVCSDNSSLPEVVGDAGLMFDADDIDGVAEAIARIADSAEVRSALSAAGLQRARTFNWERCAEIVVGALCAGAARHAMRPSNRKPRVRLPGAVAAGFGSTRIPMPANFLDYQNGSVAPVFPQPPQEAAVEAEVQADEPGGRWPVWLDALPRVGGASGAPRPEGGLRSRGIFKSGTAEEPLVSYITVVRNNTKTLARTIDSVQAQTYANVEHIVLDGASTDGTLDLILSYGDKLDYYASEPDKSLYDAINKAIPLARGQLICVLNSDDWLEPEAAEIAVRRMRDQAGPAMLLTTALVRANDADHEWFPSFVHPGCYFLCANDCHNGIYANRAAYDSSGPYDISYKIVADFKWIMTCAESGVAFVYTREPTVNYSLGGTSGDVRQHSIECMRVVRERFPYLSDMEVSGLYHAFFKLAGPVAAQQPDRPEDMTLFLRKVFATHEDRPDFLNAVAWASMATLRHPADPVDAASATAPAPAPIPSFNRSLKDLVKSVLHRYPRVYALAVRGYLRARGR